MPVGIASVDNTERTKGAENLSVDHGSAGVIEGASGSGAICGDLQLPRAPAVGNLPDDSNKETAESYSTPLSSPLLPKKKAGRLTNAESLALKGRCSSTGSIKDLFKRKREDAEQGLLDKLITENPFKRSNLLQRSPKKPDNIVVQADNPCEDMSQSTLLVDFSTNDVESKTSDEKHENVADSSATPAQGAEFMKLIMDQLYIMRQENQANVQQLERKMMENSQTNINNFESFKREIKAEVTRNSAIYENALKALENKVSERFSIVEAKLEEANPREAIADLTERVSRLEAGRQTSDNTSGSSSEEVRELKRRLEDQERSLISNNIVIKGLRREEATPLVAVENFLLETFGLVNAVEDVRETMREIMRQKAKLGARKVYIEHELSTAELEVYKIMKEKAKELRDEGKIVKIGYRKLKIDGVWFFWDRVNQRLEKGRGRSVSAAPSVNLSTVSKN